MVAAACGALMFLSPGPAHAEPAAADPAQSAAVQASETVDRYCAEVAGAGTTAAVSALGPVQESLEEVSTALDATGESYLLYWRGVLLQCAGQEERAAEDLHKFVADPNNLESAPGLVRSARRRISALSRGEPKRRPEVSTDRWRAVLGIGGGYQRAADWSYAALFLDLAVRIRGPLLVVLGVRPALSEPVAGGGWDGGPGRTVLVAVTLGAAARFGGSVRGVLGGHFQLAPNPSGDSGPEVLVGAVGSAALVLGPKASRVAVRIGVEPGILDVYPVLRAFVQLDLGL